MGPLCYYTALRRAAFHCSALYCALRLLSLPCTAARLVARPAAKNKRVRQSCAGQEKGKKDLGKKKKRKKRKEIGEEDEKRRQGEHSPGGGTHPPRPPPWR